MPHTPVLLHEILDALDPQRGNFVIDGTVGSAGHAAAIAERIMPGGTLLGLDWDGAILMAAKERLAGYPGVIFAEGNYADLPEILKEWRLPRADGLLIDLGVSSLHLEGAGRGFSFMRDEPLEMTFSRSREPVADLIARLKQNELEDILRSLGGERFAGRIARAIAERKRMQPIRTSGELAEVVRSACPRTYERGRIHPATRTFQALRIFANGELENLERVLLELPDIVRPGGRVAVVSFHSLEDRIVKNEFRRMEKENALSIMTKRPVRPSQKEMALNKRSRSARLRAAYISRAQGEPARHPDHLLNTIE